MICPARLLIDGDSCPADRRATIANAANRLRASSAPPRNHAPDDAVALFFVHERVVLSIPGVRVMHGPDADQALLAHCRANDVVITRDLLLASQIVRTHQTVQVIDYCGRSLNADSIRPRLSYREALLAGKVKEPRGARGELAKCKKQFADSLDRIITHATHHPH